MTTTTDTSTTQAAKEQAAQVAGTAGSAAADVAGTAKEQATQVVGQAVDQATDLVGQATKQLNAQAAEQTQRLSGNVRQLADHLSQMADAGEQGTSAQSLVRQAAGHASTVAGYLDGKEPGDLVGDLQRLGRRRPGAFLLGAAIAGVVVGRLATAAKKAQSDEATTGSPASRPSAALDPLGATPAVLPPDPMPPVRNVAPGAPTVEPYPTPESGLR